MADKMGIQYKGVDIEDLTKAQLIEILTELIDLAGEMNEVQMMAVLLESTRPILKRPLWN